MSLIRGKPLLDRDDRKDRPSSACRRRLPLSTEDDEEALLDFDWAPTVDIDETADEFQIRAELRDVNKEDVKVSVNDRVLCIEGERKRGKAGEGAEEHRVEPYYGSFRRTFALPDGVDEGQVRADFTSGVLNVRLPKSERPKPSSIPVKVT
jgi:HSP20 family protein